MLILLGLDSLYRVAPISSMTTAPADGAPRGALLCSVSIPPPRGRPSGRPETGSARWTTTTRPQWPVALTRRFASKNYKRELVELESRILYDDENLYVGLIAYDSDPSAIIATELRRDEIGHRFRGSVPIPSAVLHSGPSTRPLDAEVTHVPRGCRRR